jgi:glycosyltransferase involved in cell wall biosynthesis
MLSICIPVYNQNVVKLVKSLHAQAEQMDADIEILLFDDASDAAFRAQNASLESLPLLHYRLLDKNEGRSRIRNMLAREARFEWLLFMDGDSKVPDHRFLHRYISTCNGKQVICGGRTYEAFDQDRSVYLHWLYGTRREQSTARQRLHNANQAFMSNNFLIRKDIMLRWPFDEHVKGYGHEDTLFGFVLIKNGIQIDHIDNPLVHTGLETNELFLQKSRNAVKNLTHIYSILKEDPLLADMVRLIRAYKWLISLGLRKVYLLWFRYAEKRLHRNLMGSRPSLRAFDLCKLGWMCRYSASEMSKRQGQDR